MDYEIKAQIVYESLCENHNKKFIDDLLGYLHIEIKELADDILVKKILGILNINIS